MISRLVHHAKVTGQGKVPHVIGALDTTLSDLMLQNVGPYYTITELILLIEMTYEVIDHIGVNLTGLVPDSGDLRRDYYLRLAEEQQFEENNLRDSFQSSCDLPNSQVVR